MEFADFDEPPPPGPPVDLSHRRHLLQMREHTKAEIAELEDRLKRINAEVERELDGAEVGLLDGKEVVRRVWVTKRSFSSTALRAEDPDTYERYLRPSTYSQMRWKEIS